MRLEPLDTPATWRADTLIDGEGRVHLNAAALAELNDVAVLLKDNPLPTEVLRPEDFELSACGEIMGAVKQQIRDGIGFAIVDRLPVEAYGKDIATARGPEMGRHHCL